MVEWLPTGARVACLTTGATDDDLIGLAEDCAAVGIDAPFGWPEPFVEFVQEWHGNHGASPSPWSVDRRDALRFRLTDLDVARRVGRAPLSVSSDRIALPALRCAGLLGRLGVTDRSGVGRVIEVYPAAALKTWRLRAAGYKGLRSRDVLQELVRALFAAMPPLEASAPERALLERDDHAFDALVSALVARAAALGRTERPPQEARVRASREGWIAIPTCTLGDLIG
jgi:predicted nuclease with RNAse H fold